MLKQAIIDANALREVALKNAEAIVVGKYSNQIKEAVDNLLEQDEEGLGFGGPAPGLGAPPIEPGIADQVPLAAVDGEKLCPCPEEGETITIDMDGLQQIMADLDDEGGSPMPGPTPPEVLPPPGEEEEEEELLGLTEDEDVEIDLSGLLMEDDEADTDDGMPSNEDAEMGAELSGEEGKDVNVTETSTYKRDDDDEDITEDTGGEESEHYVRNAEDDAERLAHARGQHRKKLKRDMDYDEEHIALQESNKKILKENTNLTTTNSKIIKENKSLRTKKNHVLKENKDLKVLLRKLSNTLEETNLSNAKLVYTNRVLTSNSLNERQKQRIAEAISNADSVDAAKSIYDTLQGAVGSSVESRNEPKSLSEAITKGSATMLRQKQRKEKQDPHVQRMKKLAGI